VETLDRDDKRGSPWVSWVHTIYLLRPRGALRSLDPIFSNLLSRFTALREFSCHMGITAEEFEVLTRTCGKTLTKLFVRFSPCVFLHSFQSMKHLAALEGLFMSMSYQYSYMDPGNIDTPALPLLRVLAVDVFDTRACVDKFLRCLTRSSLPKLTSFAIRSTRIGDITALISFLNVHGKSLTHFRCWDAGSNITSEAFSLMPNLERVGFGNTLEFPRVLEGLPQSVSTIVLSGMNIDFPHYAEHDYVDEILRAIENLPRPNMLRTIWLREEDLWLDFTPPSCRSMRSRDPDRLKAFAQQATRFLPLGIVVIDDNKDVLTDVVLNIREPTPL
jgi:hypothetical protein